MNYILLLLFLLLFLVFVIEVALNFVEERGEVTLCLHLGFKDKEMMDLSAAANGFLLVEIIVLEGVVYVVVLLGMLCMMKA